MVIHQSDPQTITVEVNPSASDRWRADPYHRFIRQMSLFGVTNSEASYRVKVKVAKRTWIVLPNKDVEVTDSITDDSVLAVTPIGENEWDLFIFSSEEAAMRAIATQNEFLQWFDGLDEATKQCVREKVRSGTNTRKAS